MLRWFPKNDQLPFSIETGTGHALECETGCTSLQVEGCIRRKICWPALRHGVIRRITALSRSQRLAYLARLIVSFEKSVYPPFRSRASHRISAVMVLIQSPFAFGAAFFVIHSSPTELIVLSSVSTPHWRRMLTRFL